MPGFDQRCIIVTGGGSGLGLAAVARLVADGATVVAVDRDPSAARAAGATGVFDADVRDAARAVSIAAECQKKWGPVAGLATFAGIDTPGRIEDLPAASWENVLAINVIGTANWVKAVLPAMRAEKKGSIVLVSSQLSLAGARDCVAYAASKGAINAMTRALAVDCADDAIRVNAVAPGASVTPMLERAFKTLPAEVQDRSRARHALGRFGEAPEIAAATAFLLGDDAAFITGVVLPVDGGWSAA